MRLLSFLAACLLFTVTPATADVETVPTPACGLQCIAITTLTSSCSVTNTTCICTNAKLLEDITRCVKSNCTIIEQLQTQRFSANTCGVVARNRSHSVWQLGIAFMVFGMVAYALRCVERLRTSIWGLDDWAITLAVMSLIPLCLFTIPQSSHGLGRDMWNLAPDDISGVLFYFWWGEIFYALSLPLLKISALLFYLRVFPKKYFRYSCYTLIALHVGYAIAFTFAIVFQCSPMNGAWLGWTGEYSTKCASLDAIGWSAAAVNILLDITTILLPVPQLLQLNMSLQKKLLLLLMFSVGLFVTIVSIIRLSSLIVLGSTMNPTQDYVEVAYWSVIEVAIGVVCVCMPGIRALIAYGFPTIFRKESSTTTSSYGYQSNRSHGMCSRPKFVNISSIKTNPRSGKQRWGGETSDNHSDVQLVSVEKPRVEPPENSPATASSNHFSSVSAPGKPTSREISSESRGSERWSGSNLHSAMNLRKQSLSIVVSQEWSIETVQIEK